MIKHDGIIIALNGDGTTLVRIVQTSAYAACKAKAMCASAESAEKEMTVRLAYPQPLPIGKDHRYCGTLRHGSVLPCAGLIQRQTSEGVWLYGS